MTRHPDPELAEGEGSLANARNFYPHSWEMFRSAQHDFLNSERFFPQPCVGVRMTFFYIFILRILLRMTLSFIEWVILNFDF